MREVFGSGQLQLKRNMTSLFLKRRVFGFKQGFFLDKEEGAESWEGESFQKAGRVLKRGSVLKLGGIFSFGFGEEGS